MLKLSEIKRVHLEISSVCNARCPGCPRSLFGYPHNNGYIEHNMTLNEAKVIFKDIIKQLTHVRINGNFGDAVSNNDTPAIVEWMFEQNPSLYIQISTNGSAQNAKFWERLGKTNVAVEFCIDGLENTHSIYRQDTDFNKIILNAETFIAAGGVATCKMVIFDHNRHQIDEVKKLVLGKSFLRFTAIPNSREQFSSYDKKGNLAHVIHFTEPTIFKELNVRNNTDVLLEDIIKNKTVKSCINCVTKSLSEIYISSVGDVYPCCFLGFEPKTYGRGRYYQAANSQFKDWLTRNNAVKYTIDECIEWFNQVEDSWKKQSYEGGRLVICDDACGK